MLLTNAIDWRFPPPPWVGLFVAAAHKTQDVTDHEFILKDMNQEQQDGRASLPSPGATPSISIDPPTQNLSEPPPGIYGGCITQMRWMKSAHC